MIKSKLYASALLFVIVLISILIVILPTFFTKGVSRIELHKEIVLPLILNDDKDVKIIFFGYSGCVDICMPRLFAINEFYSQLSQRTKNRVGVEFLDISIPENKNLPSDFAMSFNKDFKGIYLDKTNLRTYTKEFSVYFSQSLMNNKEYDHTANIYIVKRTKDKNLKEIRYAYNAFPYDFVQIKIDIEDLLNE